MNPSYTYMLHLLGCAARGAAPDDPGPGIDWDTVYATAREHMCSTLIFPQVRALCDRGAVDGGREPFVTWKAAVLAQVARDLARKNEVASVFRQLDSEGVQFIVLKGESLAGLYSAPDYRISSDTDILLQIRDEKRALALMSRLGADITVRVKRYLHSRCRFPVAGLIELHTSLVDDYFSDVCFGRYNDTRMEDMTTRQCRGVFGETYTSLGGESELIFVTTHFIKHFVGNGATVRQITDTLLVMRNCLDCVDWSRVSAHFEKLKMSSLLSAVVKIGVLFLGFDRGELPVFGDCPDEVAAALALYIIENVTIKETGPDQTETNMTYARARYEASHGGSFAGYIFKWRVPRIIKRFFPGARNLRLEYPYAAKHLLLVPAAFIHNIGRTLRVFFSRRKISSLFEVGSKIPENLEHDEKIKLLRKLDMM